MIFKDDKKTVKALKMSKSVVESLDLFGFPRTLQMEFGGFIYIACNETNQFCLKVKGERFN